MDTIYSEDDGHSGGCESSCSVLSRSISKVWATGKAQAARLAQLVQTPLHTRNNNPNFCSRCQVLKLDDRTHGGVVDEEGFVSFPNAEENEYRGKHLYLTYQLEDKLPNLPILQRSALRGCSFCSLLIREIRGGLAIDHGLRTIKIQRLSYRFVERLHCCSQLPLSVTHVLDALYVYFEGFALRLEIQADADDLCTNWLAIERRPLLAEGLSPVRMQYVKNMVERAHEYPSKPTHITPPYIPTRLLDVSAEANAIRLVSLRNQPDSVQVHYAALSYCWGPPGDVVAQVKTERSSLEERKAGITIDSLPATVHDAVCVCRSLGIPYLWVDALCIIQGDREDWERESMQMGRVYEWAYITICAAQGNSCTSGMLANRTLPDRIEIPFASTLNPTVHGAFSLISTPNPKPFSVDTRIPYSGAAPDHSLDILGSVWNTRAWTFQEVFMSPILLFFGRQMAYTRLFEGAVECENGTSFILNYLDDASPFEYVGLADHPHADDIRTRSLRLWYSAVQHYSMRDLTYAADRLPALSALASVVAGRIETAFMAGLWEWGLHYGLVWFRAEVDSTGLEHNTNQHQHLSPTPWDDNFGNVIIPPVAPSWSWASRGFPVRWNREYHGTIFSSEVEMVRSDIIIDGLNPYGRIQAGGRLTLLAKLYRPLVHSVMTPSSRYWCMPKSSMPLYDLFCGGQYVSTLNWDGDISNHHIEFGQILMMLTCRQRRREEVVMLGILVVPIGCTSLYRRVGVFQSEDEELGGAKLWEEIVPSPAVLC